MSDSPPIVDDKFHGIVVTVNGIPCDDGTTIPPFEAVVPIDRSLYDISTKNPDELGDLAKQIGKQASDDMLNKVGKKAVASDRTDASWKAYAPPLN